MSSDIGCSDLLVGFPVSSALIFPFVHKFLILSEFVAVVGALSLLDCVDQSLFLLALSKSCVEIELHRDIKLDQFIVLHLLVRGSDVSSFEGLGRDTRC